MYAMNHQAQWHEASSISHNAINQRGSLESHVLRQAGLGGYRVVSYRDAKKSEVPLAFHACRNRKILIRVKAGRRMC